MNSNLLSPLGLSPKEVLRNLSPEGLVDAALTNGEGILTNTGALSIVTGKYTGRSPKDKFIIDTSDVHDQIAWGSVNTPMSEADYQAIKRDLFSYLNGKTLYVFDGYAGADEKHTRKFRVITEMACQNLFIHQLLIRPTEQQLESYGDPDYVILSIPGFKCDPQVHHTHSEAAILVNFTEKMVLIAGTQYSGEIKKSVFTVMNYEMPLKENVLPMHCSANMDPVTNETAIFFGLSGTGKTTLSADATRKLIGDDEHGWSDTGVFNFEGGCYAKCINLDPEKEPEIYNAIRFGAELENVIVDPETRIADYDDDSLTENTRVGYPIEYIENAQISGVGGIPKVVIFLTADAFGVLPPIARLDQNSAMYHFVTGFTSKLAGTERGVTQPQPTFSTLFGEPFMPLNPAIYAEMLGKNIKKSGTKVYLVNTGWTGGSASSGAKRMKLQYTREMVRAALSGKLDNVTYRHHDVFNIDFPVRCPNVPDEMLDPRALWADTDAYDRQANQLAAMFEENFKKKYPDMPQYIADAGPKPKWD